MAFVDVRSVKAEKQMSLAPLIFMKQVAALVASCFLLLALSASDAHAQLPIKIPPSSSLLAAVTSGHAGLPSIPAACPGCCSSHGGISNSCGTGGRIRCNDGTTSPTCLCSSCGVASTPSPTPTPSQSQSITFNAPTTTQISVHTITLLAFASSGLAVTYVSLDSSFCTVSGSVVTLLRPGTCTIEASQSGNSTYFSATPVIRSFVIGAGPLDYTDMWWAGQAENGWGMSIQQHGNIQFNAIYVYDDAGKPTWYVMPGGTWNSNFTTFSGPIYQPTSAPLNNYNPAQFVAGASPGNVTIAFTSNSTATLQYTIGGISGQKAIQRQEFGSGTSPLNVGDMWWGGSAQDGWGISIVQRTGILFGAWYTYGPDGKVAWYVLPSGMWVGTTYSGPFYSTTGSPWLGATYNPNQLAVTAAGTMTLNFSSATSATMTYTFTGGSFAGTTQSKAIIRMGY